METQTQRVMDNAQAIERAKADRLAVAVKLADAGLSDAGKIKGVSDEAGVKVATFARILLKQRALELQGDETRIRDYLSGFRKGFPKSGDQRAAEAGAVLRAYAKSPEVMDKFEGGYTALVVAARDVVGRKPQGQRTGSKHAPTDTAMAGISEKIAVMKPEQAVQVAEKAAAQIRAASPKGWELLILKQMETLCNQLAKSEQPIYQKAAEDIGVFCSDALDSAAIEHSKTVTPAPATFAAGVETSQDQQQAAA